MIMTEGDGCDDNSDGDGCDDDSDGGGCDMIVTEGSGCGLYWRWDVIQYIITDASFYNRPREP